MKQDRFLTGIVIGIAVLIIAAVAVFLTRDNKQTYGAENTPDGVVHNYVLAVLKRDYTKAYGYLADLPNKPSYDTFQRSFSTSIANPSNTGIKIGTADVTGEYATVNISTVNAPSDPLSSEFTNNSSAQLVMQNGSWRISSMQAYNLWDYNWYQVPPK